MDQDVSKEKVKFELISLSSPYVALKCSCPNRKLDNLNISLKLSNPHDRMAIKKVIKAQGSPYKSTMRWSHGSPNYVVFMQSRYDPESGSSSFGLLAMHSTATAALGAVALDTVGVAAMERKAELKALVRLQDHFFSTHYT